VNTCAAKGCDATFAPNNTGSPRRFCSSQCQKRDWRDRTRKELQERVAAQKLHERMTVSPLAKRLAELVECEAAGVRPPPCRAEISLTRSAS